MNDATCPLQDPDLGLQFPCRIEITAIGLADADVAGLLPELLRQRGLDADVDSVKTRASSAGKYVSVTMLFHAQCRADYDAAHGALRAHPAIKWTL
ncbi:MAG: DUF493 family protein [Aquimonas sp.]|jgi:putative lipoic acid-binding regulatory protein|nr:DUF493 family protein [Xanthomonadales bacterium]MCC6504420.1 DUF493 family protein [Aquimonas sp.]